MREETAKFIFNTCAMAISDEHPLRSPAWQERASGELAIRMIREMGTVCDDYDARLFDPVNCIRDTLESEYWEANGWIVENMRSQRVANTSYGHLYSDVCEFGFRVEVGAGNEGLAIFDGDEQVGFAYENHPDIHPLTYADSSGLVSGVAV